MRAQHNTDVAPVSTIIKAFSQIKGNLNLSETLFKSITAESRKRMENDKVSSLKKSMWSSKLQYQEF